MRGLSNLRLLLVEDDPTVSRATARFLERLGHKVVTSFTVREALAEHSTFDCAVLDVDLPDGNGVSLAEELLERGTTAVVVFYSGSQDRLTGQRALALGPFVPKSSGAMELLRTISEQVSRVACEMVAGGGPVGGGPRDRARSGARRKV